MIFFSIPFRLKKHIIFIIIFLLILFMNGEEEYFVVKF
jgi:hypothetical protein